MKLKIKHSIAYEVGKVSQVFQRLLWYKQNGYKINLPKSLRSEIAVMKPPTLKRIRAAVVFEYRKGSYKRTGDLVMARWPVVAVFLKRGLRQVGLIPVDKYILVLTKYGTGGAYNLPNKIIINFRGRSIRRILAIIIHEIIHLSIEPLIQKYQVKHWYKERIVDLIFAKTLPQLARSQKYPIKTKAIDKVFARFFPDVEKVLREM